MDNPPGDRPLLPPEAAPYTNRLVHETSPYLLQHAQNPVDWYPWGDEAFAEARRRNVPVFLSIGYSTCHWCHVMERESFEDREIAQALNDAYVAIKVDREERPDVDAIYMTAVQALTGAGGWPMSVWLDHDHRPFFAATYIPPRDGDRGAAKGFLSILRELAAIFAAEPRRVAEAASSIGAAISGALAGAAPDPDLPGVELLDAVAATAAQRYDPVNGGVPGAPKFPSSFPVRVLLRVHRRSGDAGALAMAEHTLAMMAAGGIADQLGGGFHRYATDARWRVPHFEKMLYDNALLAPAYAEAYQVTGRPDFARVVRTTLEYLLREMTAPEGGFYAATDADSEGEEGRFFAWTPDEIRSVLGPRAAAFAEYYGVTERGNFEGRNVLYVPQPDEARWEALAPERELLRQARERRPHPLRDEKVVAAWNGLAISAFAVGGSVLGEPRFVAAAARGADFFMQALVPDGRIQRSWKDGRPSGPGFHEDDALGIAGLLDCYEATFAPQRLADALVLAERSESLFADVERGGWFRTAADHERLLAREKPTYDGAEPTGASVALRNVLRLHAFTGDDRWRAIAERALRAYGPVLREHPTALAEMLIALDAYHDAMPEIVLVWPPAGPEPAALLAPLRTRFLPNRALLGAAEGEPLAALARLAPPAAGKTLLDGRPTAYVCRRGACRLPTSDPLALAAELEALAG